MFNKILIANRGEIAVRIVRACREMGITPVAVYSDADRAALHVRMAAEAYHIGPAPASESYLNIDRILTVAKRCGAEALHPGYGFLSENPDFAEACSISGIRFIGPSPASMRIMGSKTEARQKMEKSGVPCVPGNSQALQSLEQATQIATHIGFPVMLKAAAGGGGKGMRLVTDPQQLQAALEAAQSEALRAFGNSDVYIEKAILSPRHIEVQILADEHGNTIHLGERECSIQRRHQKVLEESPSSFVDADLRQRMGEAAVRVATAADYTNAGTVEFLVDNDKHFYFLEMNTRLQVEHPVTELVTGLDLVRLQIRIAANEKLPLLQDDVQFRGHAIECRLYAEDPDNHYFPSPGRITLLQETAGPGIRLDTGVYEGWTVPNDYDPLLAKLIGYGQDRDHAISRLLRALDEIFVGGIHTNLSLFRKILNDTAFQAGKIDTGYLERLLASSPVSEIHEHSQVAAIAAVLFNVLDSTIKGRSIGTTSSNVAESNWKRAARTESSEISEQFVWRGHSCPRRLDRSCSWKCPNTYDMVYNVNIGGRNLRIALERTGETWKCELDGVQVQLDARPIRPDVISLILEGAAYEVKRDQLGNHTRLWINNTPFIAEITDPRSLTARSRVAASSSAKVLASMPGKVLRVMVRAMDQVEVGQALLVLEAMKMQNEIKSPNKGIVKQLMTEGDYVNAGDVLAIVE